MDSELNPFDTTFMNIQSQSANTIPQRCLVALIDVNRLKVNLSQLRQTVGKQLQKFKGVLNLASQAYQEISSELIRKIVSIEQKQSVQQSMHKQYEYTLIQKDNRIQQMQQQKDKIMGLLKRQTDTMGKLKLQHQLQIQRLNLRISQLYSIIHQKSAQIQALNIEDGLNKQLLRSYHTHRKPMKSFDHEDRHSSVTRKQNRGQSSSRGQCSFNDRKTSRDNKHTNTVLNKQKSTPGVPFSEVNFALDPLVMQKISDLITSINHTNINYNSKQNQLAKVKQYNPRTSRQECQKSEQTQKFQNKSCQKKPSTLDNLFKNAMKGCRKSSKLFK